MQTRIFKSGNSLAVRIPKDLAFMETTGEVTIERMGDGLLIRPARRKLTGLMDKFAAFSPDFMAEGRELHEEHEREGW